MIMTIARPRLAFTLIELLVSIALGTFLTGTAVTMFFTTQHLAKRTQARLQLHASAKSIYESMRRDLQSLQQDCAFWLLSRKSDGESAGIDLVFMTGVFDDQGFLMGGRAVSSGYDNIEWKTTDLVWCRWSWSGDATDPTRAFRLWTARNDMKRTCTNTSAPTLAGVPYTVLNSVAYNPQPRRATSAWSTYPADDASCRYRPRSQPAPSRSSWPVMAVAPPRSPCAPMAPRRSLSAPAASVLMA
jgi:type II secretory pathway pseudopilin PulG